MKQKIFFLILLISSFAGVRAAENNPEFHMDSNGSYNRFKPVDCMRPGQNQVLFEFCYYNDDGKDSWCDGLDISFDGVKIGKLCSFKGEDGNDDTKDNESVSATVGNVGKVTATLVQHWRSGDNYWIQVRVQAEYLAFSKSHYLDVGCYWWANWKKKDNYYSAHMDISTSWTYMSMSGSVTSPAPYKCKYKNSSAPYSYDQYMIMFKTPINGSSYPWVEATKDNSYGSGKVISGSAVNNTRTDFNFTFDVPGNFEAKTVYPRYYIEDSGVKFYDYVSSFSTPHFCRAKDVRASVNQWTKEVTLSWAYETYDNSASRDGKWMIVRMDGTNTGSRTYLSKTDFDTRTYTDKTGKEYDKDYTYEVYFVPTSWGAPSLSLCAADLVADTPVNIERSFPIDLTTEARDESINLTWTAPAIQSNGSYRYTILRQQDNKTAETLQHITVTDRETTKYEYEDTAIPNARSSYHYWVKTTVMGKEFSSDERVNSVTGFSRAMNLTASKGSYSNSVNLRWTAKQYGTTATYYTLYRRVLGTDDEWEELYAVSGTNESYMYNDQTLVNGLLYEYKVHSHNVDPETNEKYGEAEVFNNGFCSLTGTISGNVSFGSGTAVENVKVSLETAGDEQTKQFYALNVQGAGGGIEWEMGKSNVKRVKEKPWTLQMYVNPNGAMKECHIFQAGDMLLSLNGDGDEGYRLMANDVAVGDFRIPADVYTHLTVSYTGSSNVQATFITRDDSLYTGTANVASYSGIADDSTVMYVGSSNNEDAKYGFIGHVDDVRFFADRVLDETTIKRDYNHTLSGDEEGLLAYWPLDEGIMDQKDAYDYSTTNSKPNENHAKLQANHVIDRVVPDREQLGLYALTDATGNYIIRGVHYTGNGTNYILRPSLGIHEFSPNTVTRFVSATSNVYSGTDFTDVSSFPVSGVVYYEGTNYPVEECTVYVDGVMANKDGEAVKTDKDGLFTVDVPIGDHFISLKKDDHTFVSDARFPTTGRYTFNQKLDGLTFYDNTTVVVTGRIDGGTVEYDKPLGFSSSVNNIGQAEIVLETDHMINAVEKVNGLTVQYVPNTEAREFEAATNRVSSTAKAGTGDIDAAKTITIMTDVKSGEFAVKLPPLNYRVKSVTIPTNAEIEFKDYTSALDATNVQFKYTDSLKIDDSYEKFEYTAKFKLAYRSKPVFEVKQKGVSFEGAFGEDLYTYFDNNGGNEVIQLYEANDDGSIKYNYGFPIFNQLDQYTFELYAYEPYDNHDAMANTPHQEVPLSNTSVTVSNELSVANYFKKEDGSLAPVVADSLSLDSLGKAEYVFQVGVPSLSGDYSRSLMLSYNVNGVNHSWTYGGASDGIFRGIAVGHIPMGNNFVTAGPDMVTMILRDPPGSKSSATWKKETSHSHTYSYKGNNTAKEGFKTTASFGVEQSHATGFLAYFVITPVKTTAEVTNNFSSTQSWPNSHGWTEKTTTSESVSTSSDQSYDGPDADVFIGRATNHLIGRARDLGFHKKSDGKFVLDVEEIYTLGTEFKTDFRYDQNYINTTLIPQFRNMRNSMILPMNTEVDNPHPYYLYVSDVPEGDANFGQKGYYHTIDPTIVESEAVYEDSVIWCNDQISRWEKLLAQNEEAKVTAIQNSSTYWKKNYSFDSGTSITASDSYSRSDSEGSGFSYVINDEVNIAFGLKVLGIGTKEVVTGGYSYSRETYDTDVDDSTSVFTYTLAESGTLDALTVDVFNAPDKYGPIFYTRGGQTSSNWAPQYVTEYYKPGTEIMAATQKIRVPKVNCVETEKSNIPVGSSVTYDLILTNESEVNATTECNFDLKIDQTSNIYGADVMVNGQSLVTPVTFKVPYGKQIPVTIKVTQTDLSQLDYDLGIVLLDPGQKTSTMHKAISDTIRLKAHFVEASSPAYIATSTPILNSKTGGVAELTISGYDLNLRNLRAIQLQHKGSHDIEWTTDAQWSTNAGDQTWGELLTDPTVSFKLDMTSNTQYPEQTYLFRTVTISDFGGKTAKNESEPVEVVKDLSVPTLMETPSPMDGRYDVGDDVSITFNEDIRSELITKENVTLTGLLNNSAVSHETSLLCDAENGAVTSAATMEFSGSPLTINMWLNWQKPGFVLSKEANGQLYGLKIEDDGRMTCVMEDNSATSEKKLPQNKWVFLTLVSKVNNGKSTFDMAYATDDVTETLFENEPMSATGGYKEMYVGYGFTGYVHDLVTWNESRTLEKSLSERSKVPNKYTPLIENYWPFDEGHGTTATDIVHGFDIKLSSASNWHINSENYALVLKENQQVAANLSYCAGGDNDSYLLQMWFRAEKEQGTKPQIFSINGTSTLRLDANDGHLLMINDGEETTVTTEDMRDGQWHNFSMIVRKSTNANATIYIDAVDKAVVSARKVSNLLGDLLLGGDFNGYIDEIRVTKGDYTADVINSNMYERQNGEYVNIDAYYPFEKTVLNSFNLPEVQFTLSDMSLTKSNDIQVTVGSDVEGTSEIVPPLKPAKQLKNVAFNLVTSERRVKLVITEPVENIEGCTLYATVTGIQDIAGNTSAAQTWSFTVHQNFVDWLDDKLEFYTNYFDLDGSYSLMVTTDIMNMSTTPQEWSLMGVPSWLEPSETSGTLDAYAVKTITFTVQNFITNGTHKGSISLVDGNGISRSLPYTISCLSNTPDWVIYGSEYENSMNMIGQVILDGKKQTNSYSMLAAFDKNGTVRGMCYPKYNSRFDSYFMEMTIYGHEADDDKLTFKFYDAEQGFVHPDVKLSEEVTFTPNKVYGTYNKPFIWTPDSKINETFSTSEKWAWMSIDVIPEDNSLEAFFSFNKVDGDTLVDEVVNNDSYARYENGAWTGELTKLVHGTLYKVHSLNGWTVDIVGEPVQPRGDEIEIRPQWNWLGANVNERMSLSKAFYQLSPQEGDVVKNKDVMALYTGGDWTGQLTSIIPTHGYFYYSNASTGKTFRYPTATQANNMQTSRMCSPVLKAENDYSAYTGTMTITAVIEENDVRQGGCQLLALDALDNVRGAKMTHDEDGRHLIYMVVHGNDVENIRFKVVKSSGETVECRPSMNFEDGLSLGSSVDPLVFSIDPEGISDVTTDGGKTKVYDLQGRRVVTMGEGVYIEGNGKIINKK